MPAAVAAEPECPPLSAVRRGTLVVLAAVAYWVGLGPTRLLLGAVLDAFGNPPYAGLWVLIPHVLLYSTPAALFSLAAWMLLVRARWLPAPVVGGRPGVLRWGLAGGAVAIALSLAYVLASGGTVHPPRVDPWLMAGNLFSNFYEELVFRGFVLAALTAALGFWPAAIVSSVAFGSLHTQYPLAMQALVAGVGLIFCIARRGAGSLLAPYLAHTLLDWILDPIL